MSKPSELASAEHLEFVTLVCGGQSFCIEITQIREIRRWSPITILPHAPMGVLGVINLRGAVIPILDLAARLGLGPTVESGRHVIVIARVGDRTIGLLVDSVSEIIGVKGEQVRELPSVGGFDAVECIRGLIELDGDMTRVVDLQAVAPPAERAARP